MEKLPDLEAIKVDLKSSQMPGNVAAAARLLDAIPGLIAYAEWLREMLVREHGPETYPACYRIGDPKYCSICKMLGWKRGRAAAPRRPGDASR